MKYFLSVGRKSYYLSPAQGYLDATEEMKVSAFVSVIPTIGPVFDLLLLKVDEKINRENVRNQIMNAIESDRQEKLAAVSASK